MRSLLRLDDARTALRTWLLKTHTSDEPVRMLDVSHAFFIQLFTCTSKIEASQFVLTELGPRFLGDAMPATDDETFHALRAKAEAAAAELSLQCLPKFVHSKASFKLIEGRAAINAVSATTLVWDPLGVYSPSVRGWLSEVGALGLGLSCMCCIMDTSDEVSQPIVFVNEAFCAATGQSLPKTLGRPVLDVLRAATHSEDQATTTFTAAMVGCKDALVMLSGQRKTGERFKSLAGLRSYTDDEQARRFCVSLLIEIPSGDDKQVRKKASQMTQILKLLPFGHVPTNIN